MSDGRETKNDSIEILNEKVQKIFLYKDESIFAGVTGPTELVSGINILIQNNYDKPLSGLAEFIQDEIIRHKITYQGNYVLNMVLGGLNQYGEIELYKIASYHSSNKEITSIKPISIEVEYLFLPPPTLFDKISEPEMDAEIKLYIGKYSAISQNNKVKVNKIKRAQADLNKYVACLDDTVNNITDYHVIYRK